MIMSSIPINETTSLQPERCVIILDDGLPAGKAVNAAAVIALTVGQRHPALVGQPLIDGDRCEYPGLIPIGIPVLAASADQLKMLLESCRAQDVDKVIFPVEGQETTRYDDFTAMVLGQKTEQLQLLGMAIIGGKKNVRKLTAQFKLFG
jgi:hypothetical protein